MSEERGCRSTTTSGSSGDDKSLIRDGHKALLSGYSFNEYEVDEVYNIMGTKSRATVLVCFLMSLFGEMFAPFGIIAPLLQVEVPTPIFLNEENGTDMCNVSRESWIWENKHRSIISEFELQCEPSMLTNLATAVFFVPGMAIGLLAAGYLSDKFGRKKTNIFLMLGSAVSACAMGFSTSYEMYLCFQAVLGFTLGGTMVTRVLWMLEFVTESMRPYASAISAQFFCVGTALVPLFDYYLQDWRMLDFIIAVYSVICVLMMLWLPESPHWLVTNNKTKELKKTMQRLIKINRSKLDLRDIKIIPVPQHKESGNLCIVFSDIRTLGIVVGLVFMWFLTSFFYYGFFHMIGTLNGTVHWNITIMGIMEGPCLIIAGLATTKLGRKKTMYSLLIIVMSTCLLSLFNYPISADWDSRRIFSLIGSKAGSGPMFLVVYILTLEAMPTSIRSIGMCTCSLIARLGAASPPFFLDFCQQYWINLHYLVYVGLCLFGLVVTYCLPETKGETLKQTLAEGGALKQKTMSEMESSQTINKINTSSDSSLEVISPCEVRTDQKPNQFGLIA